jgi:superfamily I DNA/RNA helicase
VDAILEQLRPDFDLRPSLRMRLGVIAEEQLRLTQAQYQVLDGLVDNRTAVIRGGAGTGKTFLAIEESRRAAAAGRRVLLLCFNRALARQLKEAVADFPEVMAMHLHGFMAAMIREAGLEDQVPAADPEDVFTLFQPLLCVDALSRMGPDHQFDLVVVDEAQDILRTAYLDVLESALRGGLTGGAWRFFYDPRQNLFEGVDPNGMKRLLDCRPALYRLKINCRNTAPIAVAVSLLSGTDSDETLSVEGPEVETVWYSDDAEQRRLASRHVGRLLAQGLRPADVVILSRRRVESSCFAGGLMGLPYAIDLSEDNPVKGDRVAFRTITAYKGLEADVILLVDVDRLRGREAASSLYVGASRARSQLAIFINEAAKDDYDSKAEEFGRRLVQPRTRGG